jgi:hypothetical protein
MTRGLLCLGVACGVALGTGRELRASIPGAQQPQQNVPGAQPPLDLVGGDHDANGLLLNPKWSAQQSRRRALPEAVAECGFRVTTNWLGLRELRLQHVPPCTSQPFSLHEPLEPKYAGAVCNAGEEVGLPEGHINWFPATYTGPVLWGGHADDQDYDLFLLTPSGAGQTSGNDTERGLELEFDSREITPRIERRGKSVWSRWLTAVEQDSTEVINDIIKGKYAIATGLVGLDGIHTYHAELHPVWALAIEVDTTPRHSVWLIFVRNLGNEGECGSGELPLLFNMAGDTALAYAFTLPWKPRASSVEALWTGGTSFFAGSGPGLEGPFLRADSGKALYVTFRLPRATKASDYALAYGELHLRWPGGVSAPPVISADSLAALGRFALADSLRRVERLVVQRAVPHFPRSRARVPASVMVPQDSQPTWGPLPETDPIPPIREPVFFSGRDSIVAAMRQYADSVCEHTQDPVLKALCRPLPPPKTSLYLTAGHGTTVMARQAPSFDLWLAAGVRIPAGDAQLFQIPIEPRAAVFGKYRSGRFEDWGVEGSILHCLGLCGYKVQSVFGIGAQWTVGPDTARALRVRVPDVGLRARVPLAASFVDRLTLGVRASYLWPKSRALLMVYLDGVLWR